MDKRALIVDASIALLGEEGLGSFSQPRVADRVGMRQSHITYYFRTRSDLLQAVAVRALNQRAESLRAIETVSDPAERVALFARLLAEPAQTRVLVALTQSADRDPGVREAFSSFAHEVAAIGAAFLTGLDIEPSDANLALLQSAATGISVLLLALAPQDAELKAHQLLSTLLAALRSSQTEIQALIPAGANRDEQ
jgi:AcrR family transcriptional regulator